VLVVQVADQLQLVLDLRLDLCGDTFGPAPPCPFVGDAAQVGRRRLAGRHDFIGVLVLQLVEREAAALGHLDRLGQQVGGEGLRQAQPGAQVPLGVDLQLAAALGQRPAGADRGHHVVQRLARSHVHVDVADGHQRDRRQVTRLTQLVQPHLVVELPQQFHAQPAATGEVGEQPAGEAHQLRVGRSAHRRGHDDAVGQFVRGDVAQVQVVRALLRGASELGDELAEVAVAVQVAGKHAQAEGPRRIIAGRLRHGHAELAADEQLEADLLGRHVGAHHAGDRALVGERERAVALLVRTLDEFLGLARPHQEAEGADAAQFGVVGQPGGRHRGSGPRHGRARALPLAPIAGRHANTPCRYQAVSSLASRSW
jgi:hypothetical protein